MLLSPESLRYTYAIYRLVSIYGKERLASTMTNAREDLFDRDLSKFLVQHSDIEADIREAFNHGGSVSENTLVLREGGTGIFSRLREVHTGGSRG